MKRAWHRAVHGKPQLVMADQFCTGYKCSCGKYIWTGPDLRAFATLTIPRIERWLER